MYNWQNKSIVIADDDSINIELIKLMLQSTKANIHLFDNGQKVVEFVKDNNIDIIVLDIQMPVLDGFQTAKKLQEMGFSGKLFALTALNTSEDKHKYSKYNFDEVIEKPIRKKELLEIIDKYI